MKKVAACIVENCERSVRANRRFYCHMHLSRFYRTGSLEEPTFKKKKLCQKCEEWFVDIGKGYKAKYCKPCQKKRYQLYGRSKWDMSPEGRAYSKQYALEAKNKFKKIVYDYYGWECNCCGEINPCFLSIDHVNNDGYLDRKKGITGVRLYQQIIKRGFPNDYQILCMNCNFAKKHTPEGICPHQI